ncbi:YuiB family protein [Halobacillus shinanisalinarum]|uniref:YuiB family protein n=1 Tax=Halobacillus shinanisalinarum TaxID=2932258 RepID=A0ABY4H270_9BACI|nr:YuiB family protein [Halobacillus shinanisalinarum]UOQ94230.1 YuiB family protein [Halobacillus shinanisalinarum]
MNIVQFVVSMLLFFVLFFGIGFLINMILRTSWVMAVVYPVIVLLIVDNFEISHYFTETSSAFQTVFERLANLQVVDIVVLACGFAGTITAGIVIRLLRKLGYQMF